MIILVPTYRGSVGIIDIIGINHTVSIGASGIGSINIVSIGSTNDICIRQVSVAFAT